LIRTVAVIARNEVQLMLVDPFPFMLLVVMPLVLVPFFTGGLIGGAVTSIPGLAGLFGFLGTIVVGFAFIRDHGWRTWDRLRVTGLPPATIVIGKALPLLMLFVLQQVLLLLVGWAILHMPWRGSLAAGAVVVVVIAVTEVTLGLLATTFATNIHQLNIVLQGGSLIAAGIGGAIAPLTALPHWMARVAPLSPVYWSLQSLRGVVALGWDLTDARRSIAILLGISAAAFLLTVGRYRHDEVKAFYA
jgi:ABC-2 type transport system permease protein